jgi:hypothetical protein
MNNLNLPLLYIYKHIGKHFLAQVKYFRVGQGSFAVSIYVTTKITKNILNILFAQN